MLAIQNDTFQWFQWFQWFPWFPLYPHFKWRHIHNIHNVHNVHNAFDSIGNTPSLTMIKHFFQRVFLNDLKAFTCMSSCVPMSFIEIVEIEWPPCAHENLDSLQRMVQNLIASNLCNINFSLSLFTLPKKHFDSLMQKTPSFSRKLMPHLLIPSTWSQPRIF